MGIHSNWVFLNIDSLEVFQLVCEKLFIVYSLIEKKWSSAQQ